MNAIPESVMGRFVTADQRYVGAWLEVNARIGQRQNAIALYVSLISIVSAAVIVAPEHTNWNPQPLFGLLLVISWAFAFLNLKHELTIANLRSFMRSWEGISNDSLIGYHTTGNWMKLADKYRRFHDMACTLLVISCNSVAVIFIYQRWPFPWDSIITWGLGVLSLLPIGMTLYPTWKSFRSRGVE